MTPPHHPQPPSISPRRSPRLTQSSAARDLRNLPLAAKTDRRTAYSRSASGDEHGRGPSRSSRSSSGHGRSSQGQRSRSTEPTPPQLMNFSIDDFIVVSHTTDSFTFTSAHPFFPGWVRVVGTHREDRVRNTPCAHYPEEEQRAKNRVRRDVEPPEVRRFLQQELRRKVGHSWWNRLWVCSGYTLGPGAARGIAGAAGVGPLRIQRSNDTGWAGCVPGHVITQHTGPGHPSPRRCRGVPEDTGGAGGGSHIRTGDGPAKCGSGHTTDQGTGGRLIVVHYGTHHSGNGGQRKAPGLPAHLARGQWASDSE